jgi:hypothetical protein
VGPDYGGGGHVGLESGATVAASQVPTTAMTLRRAGAAVAASWGPNLEKQQWHRGALTATAVASQGPDAGGGLGSGDGSSASHERRRRWRFARATAATFTGAQIRERRVGPIAAPFAGAHPLQLLYCSTPIVPPPSPVVAQRAPPSLCSNSMNSSIPSWSMKVS